MRNKSESSNLNLKLTGIYIQLIIEELNLYKLNFA